MLIHKLIQMLLCATIVILSNSRPVLAAGVCTADDGPCGAASTADQCLQDCAQRAWNNCQADCYWTCSSSWYGISSPYCQQFQDPETGIYFYVSLTNICACQ